MDPYESHECQKRNHDHCVHGYDKKEEVKNVFESAFDKTKELAKDAGEKIAAPFRSDKRPETEKEWEEEGVNKQRGLERSKESSALQARDAREFLGENTHGGGHYISSH